VLSGEAVARPPSAVSSTTSPIFSYSPPPNNFLGKHNPCCDPPQPLLAPTCIPQ
jgi:hypothetical protein